MKKIYFLGSFLCVLLFASSCNLINPAEKVPTYVHIDSFTFSGNYIKTGTNSHKITTAYVYLNNQSIGIFDLPVTFPVILDKTSTLQVTPGIDYNGLGGVSSQYLMYTSDVSTLDPMPGQTIIRPLKTGYNSNVKLIYNIDFEGSKPFLPDTAIVKTSGDSNMVFEGAHSAIVSLPANVDSVELINTDPFKLPANTDVYLELNYKSTVAFTVGLFTTSNQVDRKLYIAGFNPRNSWNKVYIDLKNFASSYPSDKFYLLLRPVKETNKGVPGYVIFDNIKIVSF